MAARKTPSVRAVHARADHGFSKLTAEAITLEAGLGVVGDAHAGATVKHRSRVRRDASAPNLRQVHLIHAELFDELAAAGFAVAAGALGENVTTAGVDLLALPTGTRLALGGEAVVEITGLRNPCVQIERFRPGLLARLAVRRDDGEVERKTGVMAVVARGGVVRAGDPIDVRLPAPPHRPLVVV
jgi:MOSC domain-containing protein YiiM